MWRDDAYLLDMLIAAGEAHAFSQDLYWEEFQRSSLRQHAIARVLEKSVMARSNSQSPHLFAAR